MCASMCSIADFAAGDPGPSACCAVSVSIRWIISRLGRSARMMCVAIAAVKRSRCTASRLSFSPKPPSSLTTASTRPGRGFGARASQPCRIPRRLVRLGEQHIEVRAHGHRPRCARGLQAVRPGDVPQRRHLHRRPLVVPHRRSRGRIEDGVADDAVARGRDAGGHRGVRGIGHRGMAHLHPLGERPRVTKRGEVLAGSTPRAPDRGTWRGESHRSRSG